MPIEAKRQDVVPAMEAFVANLKSAMDSKSISQTELASAADVGRPFLSRLLNGKGGNCTISTANSLANAVGIPLWKLMKPID